VSDDHDQTCRDCGGTGYGEDEFLSPYNGLCGSCNAKTRLAPLPDTGSRTNFDTGAVRDAAVGKGMPAEIPPTALRRIALRFEMGAVEKGYGRGNWRKGIPASRYIEAIARHSWSAALGETDEDHLAAVAWNTVCLMYTLEQIEAGLLPKELDDRPFVPKER